MYLFAHSFCASGIWAQPDMVLCVRVSHKASIEVSSWAAVSSEGSTGEGLLPNSLWWLLAGLVPQQLLDWGPQLFKGDGLEATLSCSPHGSLQLVSSEQAHERSQRECKQDRSHIYYNLILEVMFPTFAIFCSLGASIKSSSHLKGGAPTRTGIPGGGVIASSVRSCLPHCPLLFISHCFPLRM